jgi:hypothetical protein
MAGIVTAVGVLAAATLGPTILASAASGDHLTVSVSGNGSVTGTGGIDCPPTCDADITHASTVVLTATPDGSDTFQGWGDGACYGQATSKCSFDMNGTETVSASFTGTGPQPSPTPTPTPSPTATPTPAPTATPTPSPSPSPPPTARTIVLRIAAPHTESLRARSGRLRFSLKCSRACIARVKAKITVPHAKSFAAAVAERRLAAGTWTPVAIRLSAKLRRAIRRHATRRHPAVAEVVAARRIGSSYGPQVLRTIRLTP